MGQSAELKRLEYILRAKGSLVKGYYRVCDSSMLQARWDFSQHKRGIIALEEEARRRLTSLQNRWSQTRNDLSKK